MAESGAVVLFSGGQDSTTCLLWAKSAFSNVLAVTFDYGQRHQREIDSAKELAAEMGVLLEVHKVVPWSESALSNKDAVISLKGRNNLPTTFVPGRNALFLTLAAARAWELGWSNIVGGMCQTDFSGYPDCRREFIDSMEKSLSLAFDWNVQIHTPLMNFTKKRTVEWMQEMKGLELLAKTHTCYEGKKPPCGVCSACLLREKGFREVGIVDPLVVG